MVQGVILIVEDERPVANVVARALESGGYDVLSANSGMEALTLARLHQHEIALLVCDVVLPDRAGPIVAQCLSEVCPEMKILFTSGYSLDMLAERGLLTEETLENEDTFYLPKPFRPREILHLVNSILSMPRAITMAALERTGGIRVSAAH
jgi:two-component system, cell cycle sensor histidine kinase and response regulator CckA